ncbi:MAG: cysteine desulfurase, partial [Blastocatellia bacterium]|nr:cysteine desulfurase [Blastocatellia bacterium]
MNSRIYLDNAATTAVAPEVLEAMLPYFSGEFGNASSLHSFGQQARVAVERARRSVTLLLGAQTTEITFVSGGTEANNLALRGLAASYEKHGRHVITSAFEHPAVLGPCAALEQQGFRVTRLPVYDEGRIRLEDLRAALTDETILISIMLANNEVGTIQPLAEIGALVQDLRAAGRHIYLHSDGVQAVGKIPVSVHEMGIDALSLSGHKIHAPKGVGALFLRKDVRLTAQQLGGHHERDRRAGTEKVNGIVDLGRADPLDRQNLAAQE